MRRLKPRPPFRTCRSWLTIGFAIALLAASAPLLAEDPAAAGDAAEGPDMAKLIAAMTAAAAPVEQHAALKKLEGVWRAQVRLLGGPEPVEARGITQNEMVLGGRFLESRYKGDLLGQQFLAIALDGYDKQAGKYVGVWLDTAGTAVTLFEGEANADGTVRTMYADVKDPLTGNRTRMKGVTTIRSTSRYTYEGWEQGADGEYTKSMEIIFSKE